VTWFSLVARGRKRSGLRRWINPQHLHKFSDLAQMVQSVTRGLVVAAQSVDEDGKSSTTT